MFYAAGVSKGANFAKPGQIPAGLRVRHPCEYNQLSRCREMKITRALLCWMLKLPYNVNSMRPKELTLA